MLGGHFVPAKKPQQPLRFFSSDPVKCIARIFMTE